MFCTKGRPTKGRFFFSRNEDFHTKGTFYHITTGAKHLPMSFQKLTNKTLKILLSILVFWMSRNRYFAQKEGLRKRKSKEVCCFSKGRLEHYIILLPVLNNFHCHFKHKAT